jgi:hypothetical protein
VVSRYPEISHSLFMLMLQVRELDTSIDVGWARAIEHLWLDMSWKLVAVREEDMPIRDLKWNPCGPGEAIESACTFT